MFDLALDEVYEVTNAEQKMRIGIEVLPFLNGEDKIVKLKADDFNKLLEMASGTNGELKLLGSTYEIPNNLTDEEFNEQVDKVQAKLKALLEV